MKANRYLQKEMYSVRRIALIWLALFASVVVFATVALIGNMVLENQNLLLAVALVISFPIAIAPHSEEIKSIKALPNNLIHKSKPIYDDINRQLNGQELIPIKLRGRFIAMLASPIITILGALMLIQILNVPDALGAVILFFAMVLGVAVFFYLLTTFDALQAYLMSKLIAFIEKTIISIDSILEAVFQRNK